MKCNKFAAKVLANTSPVQHRATAFASYLANKITIISDTYETMVAAYQGVSGDLVNGTIVFDENDFPRDLRSTPLAITPIARTWESTDPLPARVTVPAVAIARAIFGKAEEDDADTAVTSIDYDDVTCEAKDYFPFLVNEAQAIIEGKVTSVVIETPTPWRFMGETEYRTWANVDKALLTGRDMIEFDESAFNNYYFSIDQFFEDLSDGLIINHATLASFEALAASDNPSRSDIHLILKAKLGDAADRALNLGNSVISYATSTALDAESKLQTIASMLENPDESPEEDQEDEAVEYDLGQYSGTPASAYWTAGAASNKLKTAALVCTKVVKMIVQVAVAAVKAVFGVIKRLWTKFVKPAYQSKDFAMTESTGENYVDVPFYLFGDAETGIEYDSEFVTAVAVAAASDGEDKSWEHYKPVAEVTCNVDGVPYIHCTGETDGFDRTYKVVDQGSSSEYRDVVFSTQRKYRRTSGLITYRDLTDKMVISQDYCVKYLGVDGKYMTLKTGGTPSAAREPKRVNFMAEVPEYQRSHSYSDFEHVNKTLSYGIYTYPKWGMKATFSISGNDLHIKVQYTTAGKDISKLYTKYVLYDFVPTRDESGYIKVDANYDSSEFNYKIQDRLATSVTHYFYNNGDKVYDSVNTVYLTVTNGDGKTARLLMTGNGQIASDPAYYYVLSTCHNQLECRAKAEYDDGMNGSDTDVETISGPLTRACNLTTEVACNEVVVPEFIIQDDSVSSVTWNGSALTFVRYGKSLDIEFREDAVGQPIIGQKPCGVNIRCDGSGTISGDGYEYGDCYHRLPKKKFSATILYNSISPVGGSVQYATNFIDPMEDSDELTLGSAVKSGTSYWDDGTTQKMWWEGNTLYYHKPPVTELSSDTISALMKDIQQPVDDGACAVFRSHPLSIQLAHNAALSGFRIQAFLGMADLSSVLKYDDSNVIRWRLSSSVVDGEFVMKYDGNVVSDDELIQIFSQIKPLTDANDRYFDEAGDVQAVNDLRLARVYADMLMWAISNPFSDIGAYFNAYANGWAIISGPRNKFTASEASNKDISEAASTLTVVDGAIQSSITYAEASALVHGLALLMISNKLSYMRTFYYINGEYPEFVPYVIGDRLGKPKWHVTTDSEVRETAENVMMVVIVAAIVVAAAILLGVATIKLTKRLKIKRQQKAAELRTAQLDANAASRDSQAAEQAYKDAKKALKADPKNPELKRALETAKNNRVAAAENYTKVAKKAIKAERGLKRVEKKLGLVGAAVSQATGSASSAADAAASAERETAASEQAMNADMVADIYANIAELKSQIMAQTTLINNLILAIGM